jgi:two-component system CheB/CheR fusion protein
MNTYRPPPSDPGQAGGKDVHEFNLPDEETPNQSDGSDIPVVGLGGSAGALDSLKNFFLKMPTDSGAAFVVIQHLSPNHASMLREILASHTRMQVLEAKEGARVKPDRVYIIPPNQYLGIRNGALYLAAPVTEHGIRMPIDFFSRALAEDRQERAIFVLFSGAGSDGTLGVRAVRGAGGLTIAQDDTAQFVDMPRSAVATGMVDLVLPPDEMPKAITNYLRQSYVRQKPASILQPESEPGSFNEILEIVQAQTGHDFRCYKKSTVVRRIERRMGLRSISDLARYGTFLRSNADEITQLDKDLLINVTAFFRDADAFEELRLKVIIPLVHARQADDALRVWVPGCSSGEEAYSIAMLLLEEIEAAQKRCTVQVFATDADEEALQFARLGVYPENIVSDVVPERFSRFFVKRESFCQVSESLRKSVIFAAQNLLADPPFSRMDIISCRNLLIYIEADTQSKLIRLFNYALNPNGYLFLGKSEGDGGQGLFEVVSKKARIFRRLTPARPINLDSPIVPGKKKARTTTPLPGGRNLPAVSYADSIRLALLSHFAASIVLVDRRGQILQFHGETGKYLNLPTGEPSLNVLDIAKEGLSLKLRSALHKAVTDSRQAVIENVQLTRDDATLCHVTVAPIPRRGDEEQLLAVIFEDVPRPLIVTHEGEHAGGGEARLAAELENELRYTQQELQSTIEELQAANEEMRTSNEEVVSTNEELQSTNEELETSKEELQSANEELTTINSELQEKIASLNKANRDLGNFLSSTQIATLFLDSELRIRLFTPATVRLFKLIPSDVGRSISDFRLNLVEYDLTADALTVARDGGTIEREVQHIDGSSYLVRLIPYRMEQNRVDGVVVTFGDVTTLRHAQGQTRRLATVVTDSNDAVILFDLKCDIQVWNRGAQSTYGWSEAEALAMNFRDLVPEDKRAEFTSQIRRLFAGETVASYETQRVTNDGRVLDVWVTTTPILSDDGKAVAIASTERDITERKRAERELKDLNEQLQRLALDLTVAEQREQKRLAEILHDDLQQILVAAKYRAGLLRHGTDERDRAELESLIEEAIHSSRSLTARLTPPVLHESGLLAALKWLTHWMQERHGFAVNMVVHEPIESPSERVSILLFQATRELLFNAIKHAKVKSARLELSVSEGKFEIIVQDDGIGFDPDRLKADPQGASRFGLSNFRERIRLLGGSFSVDSSPGRGSRFGIIVPLGVKGSV